MEVSSDLRWGRCQGQAASVPHLAVYCYWTGLGVLSGGPWVKKGLVFFANVMWVWDLLL